MCSGRVDPTFVFKALADGADGVMIAGCHPGECHYIEQNYKAMRRYSHAQAHADGDGRRAGPRAVGLGLGRRRASGWPSASTSSSTTSAARPAATGRPTGHENGERLEALEEIVKEHEEAMEVPA